MSFKFEDYWLTSQSCADVVQGVWSTSYDNDVLMLPSRLGEVSLALKKWSKEEQHPKKVKSGFLSKPTMEVCNEYRQIMQEIATS